ncbi:electron transport protein [Anaerobacillus sp. MEB173]|uniref:electron transport protein n=1 Tax=Anaerobacillus sp. MEB173 TaxID=3383345 RepID=UPI003F8DAB59
MKKRWVFIPIIVLVAIAYFSINAIGPKFAYIPPNKKILGQNLGMVKDEENKTYSYDIWGTTLPSSEAEKLMKSRTGKALLSPDHGAIKVDDALIQFGRNTFYSETFDNEVFLTDILGILDGPLTPANFAKALLDLRGQGTTNLQVEVAEDVTIGGQTFKKGEKVDTGLDVPKGSYAPLGMPITYSGHRLRVGVSCAACHASVDANTGKVIEGAPNVDFNGGLLLAMASNSAAYFTNTDIESIEDYIRGLDHTLVTTADGQQQPLPDVEALENAVDETLLKWPPGNFDSTIDQESNPAQIPDSYTLGDHPYGWSGFAMAGPFKGLSSLNNNVHAQNSDILAQAEQSEQMLDIDKEVYIGTILQNAANEKYRYEPAMGLKPSEFMAAIDPNPEVPGVNEMVKPPHFPRVSLFSPNGTIISSPGFQFGEQINAMSAYQNSLVPPESENEIDKETRALGREVFQRAGCITCHAGTTLTNHKVIPVDEIGTEPSRAKALKGTQKFFDEAYTYAPNTPVPIPENAKILKVPTEHIDKKQIKLALAHDDSKGGYKVKGLIGLRYTAPYLHDGGVAVGVNEKTQLGLPGTLMKCIRPDTANSLKAVVDRKLREKVVKVNRASKELQDVHVDGSGHEYWVDSMSGFTEKEQKALIEYLLSLTSSDKR